MIVFPKFEPDRSLYAPDASGNIINCLPVRDGWGPIDDLVPISDALATTCLGAVYVRTSAGSYRIIAGTATNLYEYDSGTLGWTDRTRSSGGDYAVPSGDLWSFEVYGANLIAANITDAIQFMDINSGTEFGALAGSPPKCKYLWTAGEFLVLGNIASSQNRIMTSGIGDATFWTVGERGCDYQDFPDGEEVVGGIGAERGAIIFQRTKIRQMNITTGGDYSFTTAIVNPSRGVVAPNSIASIGPGRFVYYSPDGFFMGPDTPIGRERVDKWFDQEIDRNFVYDIRAMVDPFLKVVWFQAQRSDASKFLLGYKWDLDRWCLAENDVEMMGALVTAAVTIDGLDALFATIDDMDIPFDSRLLTGGANVMAVFNTDHKLCYLTGSPKAATLDTADIELNPGFRTFVDEVEIVGDVTDYTLKAITSDKHGGTRTEGSAKSPVDETGMTYMRSDARIHSFQLAIPAGASWSNVIGLNTPRAKRTGRR